MQQGTWHVVYLPTTAPVNTQVRFCENLTANKSSGNSSERRGVPTRTDFRVDVDRKFESTTFRLNGRKSVRVFIPEEGNINQGWRDRACFRAQHVNLPSPGIWPTMFDLALLLQSGPQS